MERSHAELQQHHYRAVRENPMYAAEGMMDVMLEELSMNIPAYEPPHDIEDRMRRYATGLTLPLPPC